MNSSWNTEQLGDVYEFSSGLSKSRSEFGSGYPFLGFKDVFYNSAVPNKLEELVQSNEKEQNKCSIQRGDVFLTRTSETMDELGMSCVALKDIPFATFNGFSKRLRPIRQDSVVPEYARYYFRSIIFKQKVNSMATMSTRASLNNEILQRLEIILPPKNEQKIIGHILETLDKKIELNQKNNKTLEEISKALFKSWFIDFDPVRAKAEGRSTGLPEAISNLFPDSFEDSELGEIPSGWKIESLEILAKLSSGKRPKSRSETRTLLAKYPLYGGAGPMGFTNEFLIEQRKIITTGRVGTLGKFFRIKDPVWISDNALIIEPSDLFYNYCFYRLLSFDITSFNRGSTQPLITQSDLKTIDMICADEKIHNVFERLCLDFFEQLDKNQNESYTLENMRNCLLPKLISGELRIPDAEKIIEEVGI